MNRWWWPVDDPDPEPPPGCRICGAERMPRQALCRDHHNAARRTRYANRSSDQRIRDAAALAAWGAAHPARRMHYRVRQQGATVIVAFDEAQLAARLSMFAGCWLCGRRAPLQTDHVKPLAAGGPHCLANIRPACPTCNWIKGDQWPWPGARDSPRMPERPPPLVVPALKSSQRRGVTPVELPARPVARGIADKY